MQVATPQSEIYAKLLNLGWTLGKIDRKGDVYVAKASSEITGQDIERAGKTPEMALAAVYRYAVQATKVRRLASLRVAAWSSDWLSEKDEIAKAYAQLPAYDDKAAAAWKALAAESKIQADAIRQQITVEVSDDPEPYMTAQEMCEDVHKNKHFVVSRANSEHPIWSVEDNVNFRIVHDVLGHCQSGGDFSWRGENLACGAHFPLVSPLAREALFTECIAQTAYRSAFKGFGPQKIGLLTQFLAPVQDKHGEHVFVPHGGLPQFNQPANQNQGKDALDQADGNANVTGPGSWVMPQNYVPSPTFGLGNPVMQGYQEVQTHTGVLLHTQEDADRYFGVTAAKMVSPGLPHDPNQFWEPGHSVPPINFAERPEDDYIDAAATTANAAKIDTEWWNEDEATQKKAIMNAFRVSLLSPRKHLRWNAAHYQALMHADPATKAVDLWHMLEEEREKHNQKLGYGEGSHLSYKKQLDYLAHELIADDPTLNPASAMKEAKEVIFKKIKEFEAQLGAEHDMGEKSELRRYNMARKMVDAWLKENYNPLRGWTPGQMSLASAEDTDWAEEQPQLFGQDDDWKPMDASGFSSNDAKYGAFMGGHLDAIEQVGQHIDQIRDVALEDLQHGGKGLLFRNAIMNMNLPGVNPKVASFAWLLLAPMSSELGIIDTHVIRGLRRSEKDMTPRDYYKMERMQRAAKDATGYSHMPLGLYHWGLWDAIRNPGEHSDHSPLRVLDPLPWDSPDAKWDAATNAKSGPWVGPEAFENARGHIERAANDFDTEFAGQPQNLVPLATPPGHQPQEVNPFMVPAV